eukprot:87636_1
MTYGLTLKQRTIIYDMQPLLNSPGVWNRQVHRPLEGFVAGISTCNFAAIGVNLVPTPALMGNVTLRKPAATAILGNYNMALKILEEAGMPPGVVNFLPSTGQVFGGTALSHPELAGVHFTGSTCTLEHIWKKIGENLQSYRSYRRLVGETGGINFQFVHPSADVENVVNQTLRSAFEYLGQKCSACSRAYVPASLWSEIQPKLCRSVSEIRTGQPDDFEAFMTAVIDKKSFDTAKSYIDWAKSDSSCEILTGGECDDSEGYFVQPTVVVTTDPKCKIISEEIFAPVLTIYVYDDSDLDKALDLCANTSPYALTGAIFARDRPAVKKCVDTLRNSAGNLYINDKSTGAVVGEQPFGGARKSGTNDKAGSAANYMRRVSSQTVKETAVPISEW